MTLDMFSATSKADSGPGPGAYEVDSYRCIGGPVSRKSCVNAMDRPMNRLPKTLTSGVEFMPITSSLSKHGKSIGPRFPFGTGKDKRGLRGSFDPAASRAKTSMFGVPKSDGPSPSYLPNAMDGFRKGWTIPGRYEAHAPLNVPGPGTYDPREWPRTQAPPMGPRPAIVLSDIPASPGPAAYEVSRDIGAESLKFSIRPITAPVDAMDEEPGYTYNHPGNLGANSRQITLQKNFRQEDDMETDVPGPGTYEVTSKKMDRRIAPSIHPVIENKIGQKEDIPYVDTRTFPDLSRPKTIHRKCKAHVMGSHGADPTIPGPQWMPDSSLERRCITIRDKIPDRGPAQGTPGPCTYNVQTYTSAVEKRPPSFSMKGPPMRDDWLPTGQCAPGPGHYKLEDGNGLPKWTIGTRAFDQREQMEWKAQTRARYTSMSTDRRADLQSRQVQSKNKATTKF